MNTLHALKVEVNTVNALDVKVNTLNALEVEVNTVNTLEVEVNTFNVLEVEVNNANVLEVEVNTVNALGEKGERKFFSGKIGFSTQSDWHRGGVGKESYMWSKAAVTTPLLFGLLQGTSTAAGER